jgi:hypothetical protein
MTFLIYDMANKGSIPLDTPAIILNVPVGAMVVVVALRIFMPLSLYTLLS